ncbi:MAG TPA: hypothetical protein P5025_02825 [Candidatus Ratteibacteria bacterium]|nr:hypothetical protein [Candidatus Ratteibacteria bacterium]
MGKKIGLPLQSKEDENIVSTFRCDPSASSHFCKGGEGDLERDIKNFETIEK